MRVRSWGVAVIVLLACTLPALAGPIQFGDVPADVAWLAHVDADAARSSAVMGKLGDTCLHKGKLAGHCDKMARECGMDPRKDLHSVTLFGTKVDPGRGVLIVRAELDAKALQKKAEKAPNHKTVKYEGHTVHTWDPKMGAKKKRHAGTLYKSNVLVLASSVECIKQALDVLDGNAPSLEKEKGALADGAAEGAVFLARAVGINDSAKAKKLPLCSQLVRLDYAEGEHKGQWFSHCTLTAENKAVARQLQTALEGIGAMAWLHLEAAPNLRSLLGKVEIAQDGDTVTAEFRQPVETVNAAIPEVCELIEKGVRKHKAKMKVMRAKKGKAGKSKQKDMRGDKPKDKGAACPSKKDMKKPAEKKTAQE